MGSTNSTSGHVEEALRSRGRLSDMRLNDTEAIVRSVECGLYQRLVVSEVPNDIVREAVLSTIKIYENQRKPLSASDAKTLGDAFVALLSRHKTESAEYVSLYRLRGAVFESLGLT